MLLSRLVGVSNFCFNLLLLFLSIKDILSSQAILFLILLYALFSRFPWSTFLPFPSFFKLHNLMYLGIDVSMYGMTIPLQRALNYCILNLHNNTHLIPKNISRHPINQSLPHIILIIQHSTPRNLASFATVSFQVLQQYSKNGLMQLINLPPLLQG